MEGISEAIYARFLHLLLAIWQMRTLHRPKRENVMLNLKALL